MTLNYAHRGFRAQYPENTMLAFQKAMEAGCHGLEMDIHLTSDGQAVVIHDETVDRTTDGMGAVNGMTFTELRKLDASGSFRQEGKKNPIPALEEVLEWAAGTGLGLNLELKTDLNVYPGIEEKVIGLVYRAGLEKRVILSSFNHYTLLRCKKIAPLIPCGALTGGWIVDFGLYLKRLGLECAHPVYSYLTEENAAALKVQGLKIHTWTVNRPEQMRRLIGLGADMIMTDCPDLLKAELERI